MLRNDLYFLKTGGYKPNDGYALFAATTPLQLSCIKSKFES